MDVVWVETANYGAPVDVVEPVRLGRFVDALHARGIRVVAWYLPGHVDQALDIRRSLAMLSFRTPNGGAFDGVALDIESTKLRNVALRSRRAVALARAAARRRPARRRSRSSRSTRGASRSTPDDLAEASRGWSSREVADAFAPMIYTGGALRGFDATYGYVTRALRLLRAHTGKPDVAIHVAGGVANRLGPEELAGFAAAVEDDGGAIGVSLYDWTTTPSRAWPVLARAQSVGQASRRRSRVTSRCSGIDLHVGEHRHEVRVARPARDDVEVDVVGDPGSGDAAEVPAEVEAARAVEPRPARRSPRRRGRWISSTSSSVSSASSPTCRRGATIR